MNPSLRLPSRPVLQAMQPVSHLGIQGVVFDGDLQDGLRRQRLNGVKRRGRTLLLLSKLSSLRPASISVATIALDHGLNATLLRRWIAEHERDGHRSSLTPPATGVDQPAPVTLSHARLW